VPAFPVSVVPTSGVPEIVGVDVLTGAVWECAAAPPFGKTLRIAANVAAMTHFLRVPPTGILSG
jgi:hypothetical protein